MSFQTLIPFTDSADYNFDSDLIEISSGKARLKDIRPANATFAANYDNNINGSWGNGVLTGIATGGATVSGGKLDLSGGGKYITYDADLNGDMQQTGTIRMKVTPNYSGTPATTQIFFSIFQSENSINNYVGIYQHTDGNIYILIINSTGATIINYNQPWVPISGTQYEIELNFDITAGATRLFVDGIQIGSTQLATGTRSSNIALMRIGANHLGTNIFDGYVEDFIVFSTVQHTLNYTPGYNVNKYSTANPTIEANVVIRMEGLDGFIETVTKVGADEIKYILKKGLIWYYWSGTAWVESDSTYNQSITATTIGTNKSSFVSIGTNVKIKAFLHSDGQTTPDLDLITIDYNFSGENADSINKNIVWGYQYDSQGNISREKIIIQLSKNGIRYKNNIVLRNIIIRIKPDANGYWEAELIENENMDTGNYYNVNFNGKKYKIVVPNLSNSNFFDLIQS